MLSGNLSRGADQMLKVGTPIHPVSFTGAEHASKGSGLPHSRGAFARIGDETMPLPAPVRTGVVETTFVRVWRASGFAAEDPRGFKRQHKEQTSP